ncbi:MAG: cupredoxin domain-containing protein [Armatimonadetes bacterium]|nr:cupredoxin domain-containing protein [Armatimonadota bacterium]
MKLRPNHLLTSVALASLSLTALAGQSAKSAQGVQKLTVTVDNSFKPATFNVKAGKPVQITFDTKHRGCAAVVVFKELKMKKPLKDGTKTIVTFTPKKAGAYNFACGMNMMKGKVVAK